MQQKKVHKEKFETLTKAEFIKDCKAKAEQYKTNVLSHTVLTSTWIKLAVKRSVSDLKRKDLVFKQTAVNRVFEFFSFLRIPIKNQLRQFELSPFQCWIISEIFGWYYLTEERRFQIALLFTARKSGKSMFAAAIALYMFIYDYEINPEIYFSATTREQANQLLKYSKSIVTDSPALKRRIKKRQFHLEHGLRGYGLLKTVQNKAERLDGLNPNCAIVDEYHAHNDDGMFNIFKTGMLSRNNPLMLITSTAGFNKEVPFFKMVEVAKRVLNGEETNDRYFYALYTLDDEIEIEKPNTWLKANPNIGVTIKQNALVADFKAAKLSPSMLHSFITKNLNVFREQMLEQWINDKDYKTCFKDYNLEQIKGAQAYIGLDLSATRDLASLVLVIENPVTGKIEVIPEFYFPKNENKRIRNSGIDLRDWIDKGYIFEMEGKTIDYDFILQRVEYWKNIFKIYYLGFDPWNSASIIPKIELLGIECKACEQSTRFFNFPLKFMEKLILDKEVNLSKNPVLRWNFRNIVLYMDGNANIKIMKNKSLDSVDGAVAFGMALALYIQYGLNIYNYWTNEENNEHN